MSKSEGFRGFVAGVACRYVVFYDSGIGVDHSLGSCIALPVLLVRTRGMRQRTVLRLCTLSWVRGVGEALLVESFVFQLTLARTRCAGLDVMLFGRDLSFGAVPHFVAGVLCRIVYVVFRGGLCVLRCDDE